jgi:GTP cyclohydrolase I
VSVCEHHLLPFTGTAGVAYIPKGRVVGLSKLARVVDVFAKRLQLQERLTKQVADAVQEHLGVDSVAVTAEAVHSCMAIRGVQKTGAVMRTSALRGVFKTDSAARSEVLRLLER